VQVNWPAANAAWMLAIVASWKRNWPCWALAGAGVAINIAQVTDIASPRNVFMVWSAVLSELPASSATGWQGDPRRGLPPHYLVDAA
jgi:hypothetical protein